MPGNGPPGTVAISCYLPEALYLWLKHHSADERTSMTALLIRYCEQARAEAEKKL